MISAPALPRGASPAPGLGDSHRAVVAPKRGPGGANPGGLGPTRGVWGAGSGLWAPGLRWGSRPGLRSRPGAGAPVRSCSRCGSVPIPGLVPGARSPALSRSRFPFPFLVPLPGPCPVPGSHSRCRSCSLSRSHSRFPFPVPIPVPVPRLVPIPRPVPGAGSAPGPPEVTRCGRAPGMAAAEPGMKQFNGGGGAAPDAERGRFPHCVVWTPIPVLT